MATLRDFFAKNKGETSLSLVGPLHQHKFIFESGPTVFVDGGSHFRSGKPGLNEFSVGDGDSFPEKLDEVLPKEKDLSDLGYVLSKIPESYTDIQMHGFLGGRRDHEMAVFGEVSAFLMDRSSFTTIELLDAGRVKAIAFSAGLLNLETHSTFSVFVLNETDVTIEGACEYQLLTPVRLTPLSSHGLSNQGHGQVTIKSSKPGFVILS